MIGYFQSISTLFIHIPKTGGSSIRDGILHNEPIKKFHGEIPGDIKYDFSFAFVRNPFERLVSSVLYCRRHIPNLTLNQCMDYILDDNIRIFPIGRRHKTVSFNGGKPFTKHHSVPITHPFNRIDLAETIYRFENYNESVKEIMDRLGIQHRVIPHLRPSQYKYSSYKEYYCSETKSRASQIFEKDLDTYKYTF